MSYQFPPDVQALVAQQMTTGEYASEDDLLREALAALEHFVHSPQESEDEYRQTVAAIREGVADMEAGRMRPLRSLLDESVGGKSGETD